MDNLLIAAATAGSFALALGSARLALRIVFRVMWVRARAQSGGCGAALLGCRRPSGRRLAPVT